MSKHTPCPHGKITAHYDHHDAEWSLYDAAGHSIDVSDAVARANIASDLAEALQFILDKCTLYGPADQAREKARAALAKAGITDAAR